MIKAKLNLATLKHVVFEQKGQSGMVKGIFIPIEANHLFLSEKGAVYLDLVAFPLNDPKEWGDHLVKQSLPKAVREAMTPEQQKETPIMGNLDTRSAGATTETVNNQEPGATYTPTNTLPF